MDEHTVELEPGDTVVLYTDGVTDTPGETDRFGPAIRFEDFIDTPLKRFSTCVLCSRRRPMR